ncbi:MAG: flagellar biosynthetic protein FliR [Vicinamibacterales bacterium]
MLDVSPLAHFGLLLVRPGMLMMLAPGIGGQFVPGQARVALTVLIALALFPSVAIPAGNGNALVTAIILREVVIGLSIGFVIRALIAGAEFAGHLSGYQIGFSYGATVDPQNGVNNTMLATLYGMLATLGFLAINGHHMLLRALAMSYSGLPIGMGGVSQSLPAAVREIMALVFIVGTRLAAPIVIVLLVVEIAVGLISRASPSLNFMIIGYPIRLIVGLFLVAALVGTVPAVTNALVETTLMLAMRTAAIFR